MKLNKTNILKILIISILFIWYGFLFIRPIHANYNDLGRHLANGREFFNLLENKQGPAPILNSNFYSYTHPNFLFLNHHWASGVIFYIILSTFGFVGLNIFSILISFSTLGIFLYIAIKKSNIFIAAPIAFFLMPMLALRNEARPEIFSYLFISLFFLLLIKYKDNPEKYKILYIFPFLILLWVNLHIYFIFGFFLIILFIADGLYLKIKNRNYIKRLVIILLLSIIASIFNPAHIWGLLYPFNIFKNYGMTVTENLPLITAFGLNLLNKATLITFLITLILFTILFTTILVKKDKKNLYANIIIISIFGAMTWMMVRNIKIYALFSIPILSISIKELLPGINKKYITGKKQIISFFIIVIITTLFINKNFILKSTKEFGINPLKTGEDASNFIIKNNIKGPLFNDYDTGGYIDFYLFPIIKPFVDNRPEAYPADFFQEEYLPLLNKEESWDILSEKYNFNAILMHAQKKYFINDGFIKRRIQDSEWIPVLKNDYHIIFLKNNDVNADIIEKYALLQNELIIIDSDL